MMLMSTSEIFDVYLKRMQREGLQFNENDVKGVPELPTDFTFDTRIYSAFTKRGHHCERGTIVHIPMVLVINCIVNVYDDASQQDQAKWEWSTDTRPYWLIDVEIFHGLPTPPLPMSNQLSLTECACVLAQNSYLGSVRSVDQSAGSQLQVYQCSRHGRAIVADHGQEPWHHAAYLSIRGKRWGIEAPAYKKTRLPHEQAKTA